MNWLTLLFLAGILVVMYRIPDLRLSVYLIPAWFGVMLVTYWVGVRGTAGRAS